VANEELVLRLKQGVEGWNAWRRSNPAAPQDLSDAQLSHTNLIGADLSDANLRGADLSDTTLIRAWLTNANLTDSNLNHANLINANLSIADLSNANLSEANLSGANLDGAKLRDANLRGATTLLSTATLIRARLTKANLTDANLSHADLSHADLSHADLSHADLSNANLSEANLSGASLSRAGLIGANLRGAGMSGAVLIDANLRGADLSGANLTDALVAGTIFADLDLASVMGLETCRHSGPSIIDHRTFQKSCPLPIPFLRGVGLPDTLIEYLPGLFNQSIQYYSCFISYSSKDQDFAERIHADLQNRGVRCWFAPHDMPIGGKILDEVSEAIRLRDKVVLILSEHSIKSDWVEDEVTKAFEEERKRGQTVLFPIRLDDKVMATNEAWAEKLRARNIGDFRRWKEHDAYKVSFERVMRDLRPKN
jgi:uncharacterized protein YjbI with pentapeptide repeats